MNISIYKHFEHLKPPIIVAFSLLMIQFTFATERVSDPEKEITTQGRPTFLCMYLARALDLSEPIVTTIFIQSDRLRKAEIDQRLLSAQLTEEDNKDLPKDPLYVLPVLFDFSR